MLAFRVLLPLRGKILTPEVLAAEFGPNNSQARQTIEQIRGSGISAPAAAYYCLALDSIAARVTGEPQLIERRLRGLATPLLRRIAEFTLPEYPTDLFKDLYLELFSPSQRHGLGEYYTPAWLAEKLAADTLNADLGNPLKRVLDPACGSGIFLVLLIGHVRRRVTAGEIEPHFALQSILRNIAGFDVNPLAVRTARTNYLCALGDLLRFSHDPVSIPVYEADSVLGGPDLPAFDYVVGNPPWVNWQNLSDAYRRNSIPLWEHYGLFPKRRTAMQTILGAAKYDLSMLMTYAAADRYLRRGGRLGFILSQTLFKMAGAGEGFRRFQLPDGTPLGVVSADDFVKLKPFGAAASRAATLVLEKGRPTEYPIEYRIHNRAGYSCWKAQPIAAEATSPWMAAPRAVLDAITRILGASDYRAREGANTGGANGVFWIEVAAQAATARARRRLTIRNLPRGARNLVSEVTAAVEQDLVYPLLRGQNVARWSAHPGCSILVTHHPGMKLRAIPIAEMRRDFPLSTAYLKRFEALLRRRPAYRRYFKPDAPFYSLFNLGDYTFARWKVVWREQAFPFTAAVVGRIGDRVVVPDHKLMMVAVGSEDEAHYLCGLLNSTPVSAAVAAYTIETQINTHVLEHIRISRFSRADAVHRRLAIASQQAHGAVSRQDPEKLHLAEADVDQCAAEQWGLAASDLHEMRGFLSEIAGPGRRARA